MMATTEQLLNWLTSPNGDGRGSEGLGFEQPSAEYIMGLIAPYWRVVVKPPPPGWMEVISISPIGATTWVGPKIWGLEQKHTWTGVVGAFIPHAAIWGDELRISWQARGTGVFESYAGDVVGLAEVRIPLGEVQRVPDALPRRRCLTVQRRLALVEV